VDGRDGGGLAYFVDATIKTPAFRDRGDRLTAPRTDPNAVRHMIDIATHRGWEIVLVRGAAEFRREAWLAGRVQGLDVRGYRPSERDLQALQRALAARRPREGGRRREPPSLGMSDRMRIVEAVVQDRVRDPADQNRILAKARGRVAAWLERGARLDNTPSRRSRDRSR
jgi:hypothetical protein